MDLVSFIEGEENNSVFSRRLYQLSVFISIHTESWSLDYFEPRQKIKFMSLWNLYTGCRTENLPVSGLTRNSSVPKNEAIF